MLTRQGRLESSFPGFQTSTARTSLRLFAPIFEKWIGKLDVPHDFVFIDDAAAAAIMLAGAEELPGQVWHVPGPGPLTGREFVEMVFQMAGTRPSVGVMGGGL